MNHQGGVGRTPRTRVLKPFENLLKLSKLARCLAQRRMAHSADSAAPQLFCGTFQESCLGVHFVRLAEDRLSQLSAAKRSASATCPFLPVRSASLKWGNRSLVRERTQSKIPSFQAGTKLPKRTIPVM